MLSSMCLFAIVNLLCQGLDDIEVWYKLLRVSKFTTVNNLFFDEISTMLVLLYGLEFIMLRI